MAFFAASYQPNRFFDYFLAFQVHVRSAPDETGDRPPLEVNVFLTLTLYDYFLVHAILGIRAWPLLLAGGSLDLGWPENAPAFSKAFYRSFAARPRK